MKRIINSLLMPAGLLLLWLMLNDSLSPGNIALGTIIAIFLSWAARSFRPLRATLKHPVKILRLYCHVVYDITRSNLAVARIIWLGERSGATPGYIRLPIRLRDPHALAVLSCILTITPGTVWSDFSESRGLLTLHVLDLKDENEWYRIVLERYEKPLMEIFE